MALTLQETYAKGHNVVKFRGKYLPKDLMGYVSYAVTGRVKILCKSIKLFETDALEGGALMAVLIRMIMVSLTQKKRNEMEIKERAARKATAADGQAMF